MPVLPAINRWIPLLLLLSPRTLTFAQSVDTAAHYSSLHSGDAVLVFRHDSLVFEQYQNGYDRDSPHPLASGTKTFACALAALGQADGLLTLDEPVARTLPELAADSAAKRLTIRQLLNLTSGLEPDATGTQLRFVSPPSRRFAYGGTSFAVFGAVMSQKLKGEDLVAFLTRRVFTSLGVTIGEWQRDGAGRPGLASAARGAMPILSMASASGSTLGLPLGRCPRASCAPAHRIT